MSGALNPSRLRDAMLSAETVVLIFVRDEAATVDAGLRRHLRKLVAGRQSTRAYVVDLDVSPVVAGEFAVFEVPTVRIYRRGKVVRQYHGTLDVRTLAEHLGQIPG